ncbi:hypothetical protein DASC09_055430 [Saccharomycopsis crataegensis]|uniref:PQ loop repeat protein n=1 Tax=Saccharomycopsis crataegensis TaxID=43959 RepID=A0AAV5QUL3_9ASCO|nr:hypothetical protein DASC09_055430 [Saccharomycopsis crataegensis]
MSSECDAFRNPPVVGVAFALVLTVGIAISYIPQHLKILHRRSSEGLSPLFLLLGTSSGISAFANLILISSKSVYCCSNGGLTRFECLNGQLGLLQVGTQAMFAAAILVLCVFFTRGSLLQDKHEYAKIYKIYLFCIWYTVGHGVIILYVLFSNRPILYGVADCFGILATALASFQYFPQIYTIYKLKHPGSLSISMMCMQTPGGFIWSASLFMSPSAVWSSWLPYFTAALLQGILLTMCVYYSRKFPEKLDEERREIDEANERRGEQEPLLEP